MSAKSSEIEKSNGQEENGKLKFKILVVDPDRCVGCEICESVCSMVHDDEFNPLNSRINRVRIEPFINTAVNCQTCPEPYCIEACQPKALTKNPASGLIEINLNKCDGCSACVRSCPFGAINVHTKTSKAIVCDLCESTEYGTPQCIEYCPKDAIFLKEIDANTEEDAMITVGKILEEGFGDIEYEEGSIIKRTKDRN